MFFMINPWDGNYYTNHFCENTSRNRDQLIRTEKAMSYLSDYDLIFTTVRFNFSPPCGS